MSDAFIARKGAAVPAAMHPGGVARFHGRRTIVLPAINLRNSMKQENFPDNSRPVRPQRQARLTGPPPVERRKFTFRIDMARHADFCRAAAFHNVSRQHLLTDALDDLLKRLGHRVGQTEMEVAGAGHHECQPGNAAPIQSNSAAALPATV